MLCCAVLCCAVLCCAVLCCAVLCCAVLCVLCCAVLCCAVLCCAVLCCAVLCCTVLCCAVFRSVTHLTHHQHDHNDHHPPPTCRAPLTALCARSASVLGSDMRSSPVTLLLAMCESVIRLSNRSLKAAHAFSPQPPTPATPAQNVHTGLRMVWGST